MRSRIRTILILAVTRGCWRFSSATSTSRRSGPKRAAPIPGCCCWRSVTLSDLRAARLALAGAARADRAHAGFANAFRTTVIGFAADASCSRVPVRSSGRTCWRESKASARPRRSRRSSSNACSISPSCCCCSAFSCLTVPAGVATGDAEQVRARQVLGQRRGRRRRSLASRSCSPWPAIPNGSAAPLAGSKRVLPARAARLLAQFRRSLCPGAGGHAPAGRLAVALVLSFPLWMSIAAGIWLTSQAFHITFPYHGFVPRDDAARRRRRDADAGRDRRISCRLPDRRSRRFLPRRRTAPSGPRSCSMPFRSSR